MLLRYLYRAFKARYRDQGEELEASLASIRQGDPAVHAGANKGAYLSEEISFLNSDDTL